MPVQAVKSHPKVPPPFSKAMAGRILKRDGYRCVMCGNGEKEGAYLQVCSLYPKSHNSGLCLADGAVFCEKHGAMVKRHGPLGAAGMMFADLGKKAEKIGDSEMANFCGEASQALGK